MKSEKKLLQFFEILIFSINVDTDLKTAEYLDVKLYLNNGIVEQYRKRNCKSRYINIKSNYPRPIIEKTHISIVYRSSGHIFETV